MKKTFEDIEKEFQEFWAKVTQTEEHQVGVLKIQITESIYLEMERQDVSRSELAARLGTSRAYVTKLLQGDVNFTLETMMRVARALDCNLSAPQLVREKPAKKKTATKTARASAQAKGKRAFV